MERTDVITYYGPINPYGVSRLIEITLEAISQNTAKICLHLDSEGGDLNAAFTAYEHLRSLDAPVHTYNLNQIRNDALLLYLAGEERGGSPDAYWIISEFGITFGARDAAYALVFNEPALEINRERFAKIFETRCQKGFNIRDCLVRNSLDDRFDKTRFDLDAALEAGIATGAAENVVISSAAKQWCITPASVVTK